MVVVCFFFVGPRTTRQGKEKRFHHAPSPGDLQSCLDDLFRLDRWAILKQNLNEQTTAAGLAVAMTSSLASVAYLLSSFSIRTAIALVHPSYLYRLTLFTVLISGRCIRYRMMQNFHISMRPGMYYNRCLPDMECILHEISLLMMNDPEVSLSQEWWGKPLEAIMVTMGESALESERNGGNVCNESMLVTRLAFQNRGSLAWRRTQADHGRSQVSREKGHGLEDRRKKEQKHIAETLKRTKGPRKKNKNRKLSKPPKKNTANTPMSAVATKTTATATTTMKTKTTMKAMNSRKKSSASVWTALPPTRPSPTGPPMPLAK